MAIFEGSLEEFNRFIGPFARNVIQQLTKKHKKGQYCEICHKTGVELQAAHVHGEERLQIIERILKEQYKSSYTSFKVDLEDFSSKFKEAHLPIEKHFKFLCQTCHKQYDNIADKNLYKIRDFLNSMSPEDRKKFLLENNLKPI